MLRTLPPCLSAIQRFASACVQLNEPFNTMLTTALKALGLSVSVRAMKLPAALLTSVSMRPNWLKAAATADSTAAGSRTSAVAYPAEPPARRISSQVSLRGCSRRPMMKICAPSSANLRAMLRPRPEPPPEMKMARLLKRVGWNMRRSVVGKRKLENGNWEYGSFRGELEEAGEEAGFGGHGGAVVGVGEEGAFFERDALREHGDVTKRTDDRGNPRGVDQRKRDQLHDHRRIIRMANEAERAGGDHAGAGGVHDLHVPVIAERSNHPEAHEVGCEKNGEHHGGKRGDERAFQRDDFDGGADQNQCVDGDQPRAQRLFDDDSAARLHGALMIARNAQLDNAEGGYDEQQREKRDDAQVHWRSRNSALKPGPKAAASAMSPGLSGRLSSHS